MPLLPKERRRPSPVSPSHSYNPPFYISEIHVLDPMEKFLGKADIDFVTRARDVVTNSVMTEISKEDPQGDEEFKNAVRHHIVANFQRLRILLLILDTLMEAYNSSI
jgi:hypothetical protein